MCCFCWTAFGRHKQKSGCVFVFPMIWQLFMPSCWAVASGCPVSYGRACSDRGKQKQLLFQVMLSSGRNSHSCRFSHFVWAWLSCHNNSFFKIHTLKSFTLSDHTGPFQPWFQSCLKVSWELQWDTLVPESLHPLPCPHTPSQLHQCHLSSCHQKWKPCISGDGRNSLWSLSLALSPGTWQQNLVKDEPEMPFLFSLPLCLTSFRAWSSDELNYKWASLTLPTWQLFCHHQDAWPSLQLCVVKNYTAFKDRRNVHWIPCRMVFWCFISNRGGCSGLICFPKGCEEGNLTKLRQECPGWNQRCVRLLTRMCQVKFLAGVIHCGLPLFTYS